jgi:uncharacterized membrane protein YcaP (DUF421 family)
MELVRLAARAVFAYVLLLTLVRVSGKRTIKQGTPTDLAVALIVGDLVDNVLWAEVTPLPFAVSAVVVFGAHTLMKISRRRAA